jgi:putative hydrolase of the HAD superfamily
MPRRATIARMAQPATRQLVGVRAVLLDFYGTLARDVAPVVIDDVMQEHGYVLPDHLREMWWNGDVDGIEHGDESLSREHYIEWQRSRLLSLLGEADVHPGEYDVILAKLQAGREGRVLEPYPEAAAVLTELRGRGLRLAVCSNWDWDLEPAVTEAGLRDLVDLLVSSAWAGARKPHPKIFHTTLEQLAVGAGEAVFVGDTWRPDVDGPRAVGITPVYLERDDHWPDATAPTNANRGDGDGADHVIRARDLNVLLELL